MGAVTTPSDAPAMPPSTPRRGRREHLDDRARSPSEFGVTHRTVRHYEDLGLISPERRGTTRVYHRRDRTRLNLILRGKRLGFPLEEIRTIIDMYDEQPGEAGQLDYLLGQIDDRRAELGAPAAGHRGLPRRARPTSSAAARTTCGRVAEPFRLAVGGGCAGDPAAQGAGVPISARTAYSSGKNVSSSARRRNGTPLEPPVPRLEPMVRSTVLRCRKRQSWKLSSRSTSSSHASYSVQSSCGVLVDVGEGRHQLGVERVGQGPVAVEQLGRHVVARAGGGRRRNSS